MSDVFDEIIDKLPPSTIRLISDFKNERSNFNLNVSDLLQNIQEYKVNQVNRELRRKIFDIKSKTEENRKYLFKLKRELEVLESLKKKKSVANEQSIKAYTSKINELECKVKSLAENQGDIDLSQLFNETEQLSLTIEDYKKKISEAKSKYQSYDNFPPDIQQAKELIAKIRERIKQNESVVQSRFHI